MEKLKNIRVLVTGVGLKPVNYIFRDIETGESSHTAVVVEGVEYKANIGTAVALACAREGAAVHLVSRTEENLKKVQSFINTEVPGARVQYSAINLDSPNEVKGLAHNLATDLPLYWVQAVGLGGGTIKVKDDNPYLLIPDIPEELVEAEFGVIKNTVTLIKSLLPIFEKQSETKICIISSMSAVRSVWSGSIHNAAKGGLSRFANAAMIELGPKNIFITDVRPGGCDTGLYDGVPVRKTIAQMSQRYGYHWTPETLRLMPPLAVGEIVADCLASKSHLTSINMVSRGQWPHEGS